MKKFTILVIFSYLMLTFMALGLTLVSCEDPSNSRSNKKEGETTFTVRFDRNGGRGTVPGPITAAAGSSITLPDGDGLSKSGYVFGGWNTEADGEGTYYEEGESFTLAGNVTLYAHWDEVVTYTVTFNSNGGSDVETQTVNAGDRATRPANPTKSGYIFAGWCRNAALTVGYNFSTPVTEDITLYARWVAVSAGSFIVTFDSNGGSSVHMGIAQSGGTATRPADPTRSNYTFDNWYCDSDMITVYNFSTPVTDNITLYAKWNAVVTYTVSFDANGGSGTSPSAQTVQAGSSITIPGGDGLSKSGYSFDGWNTEADGMGTNHSADSSYAVQNDITLYALWIIVPADSFTVTFDSNGGSSVDMGIAQAGGMATRPANPARSGYTFDNWYSDAGLTTVYNFFTPVTGNIILYAKWNINRYTVTFNADYGTPAPVPQTIDHGGKVDEPTAMSKTDYTFGGWFKEPALINLWNFATDTVTEDITLYAKWTLNQYTVTFDSNGGSSVTTQTINSGSTATRPADPARNGYTFDDWYSDENLTTVYNFSTLVMGNITLYAKWIATYTITFNSNGGSSVATQTVNSGGTATRPANPTRSNYTFDNWYSNESLTTVYNFSTLVTENITLYAKWIATYTVTFNSNGGSSVTTQTVNSGGTATRPTNPTRSGYTFDNWYSDSGLTTVYNFSTSVMGNIILNAKWNINQYTVTFNINGGSGTTPSAQTANYNSSITLPSGNGLSRTGYIFGGWNTNSFGTGTNYNAGTSYTVTGTITLYARWWYIPIPISGEMVYVSGGSFQMGDTAGGGRDYERPVHTVTMTGFYMGKYEVTQVQYQAVMGSNPASDYGEVGNNYPVFNVSWYNALVFCNKLSTAEGLIPAYRINSSTDPSVWGSVPTSRDLTWDAVEVVSGSTGYRLPTEAQWEYAAKGGNGSPGNYTYAGSNTVGDVAWYLYNSNSTHHAVGTKAPNGLGLYDMSGNVSEWCWDWYGSYSSGAQTNPTGTSSGPARVIRGGDWLFSAEDVRSAVRGGYNPSEWNIFMGFRLARPAQ